MHMDTMEIVEILECTGGSLQASCVMLLALSYIKTTKTLKLKPAYFGTKEKVILRKSERKNLHF